MSKYAFRFRRTSRRLPALLVLSVTTVAELGLAQKSENAIVELQQNRTLRIPKVSQGPKLEDFLNGKEPGDQARVTDFRQRRPADGKPASRETTAYLSYDDKNFYAVFVCQEESGQVRAHMSKREDVLSDDLVGVFLDTFRDRQRSYEFMSNPVGIQLDGIINENQDRDDLSFDTLWYSEGRLTEKGYVVRIAIPFKSLRFPNADVQTWGIGLGRFIQNKNELSMWPHVTESVEGFTHQLGKLEGLERISPARNVQLIPYGSFNHARFLDSPDLGVPSFRQDREFRAGLDAKVVLRDALTLDLTLNPDFSHVESDEPQVTINQRFEVYFPEKRPFFIENAGYFQTPENLFFSRRIVEPEFGARLTGKVGRWLLGVFAIDDRGPGKRILGDAKENRRATIGVARIQREFARQSTIGMLVTSRDFGASSNRIVSLDTRLKLNPNWVFSGQAIHSQTRQLDGKRLVGPAYLADLSHEGLHMKYRGRYTDRSPSFRSELGFIPRVDIRQTEHDWRYRWRPAGRHLLAFGPEFSALGNWDRRGHAQDWEAGPAFLFEFTGQTFVGVERKAVFERFQDARFRKNVTEVYFYSDRFKRVGFQGYYRFGARVNYWPALGLPPLLANGTDANLRVWLRPSSRFRLEENYYYTHLATNRSAIFNNHILRSKLNYQFTRELSLRAILDYNGVLPNPSLVNLERAKRLTSDILLTYLLHPGTALYVGYSDNRENLAIFPGDPPTLGRIGSPTTATSRQIFVKLSYLFRF